MVCNECVKDYTVINSQPSKEALELLVSNIINVFGFTETIDEMFYYGVFMKPQNYANYEFDLRLSYDFAIPPILISEFSPQNEKIDFVKQIINGVMKRDFSKPEWMKYIEMNMVCDEFCQTPSTFLQIEAKEDKYKSLAENLINFLYSPNLTITMVKSH